MGGGGGGLVYGIEVPAFQGYQNLMLCIFPYSRVFFTALSCNFNYRSGIYCTQLLYMYDDYYARTLSLHLLFFFVVV